MRNPITCIPHFPSDFPNEMKCLTLTVVNSSFWMISRFHGNINYSEIFSPYLYVCLSFVNAPPKFLQLATAVGEDCNDARNCPSLNKSARTWITAKNLFSFFKTCLDFALSLIHRKTRLLANELHLRWICIICTFLIKMGRIEQLRQTMWAVFSYTRSFSKVCMT